MPNIDEFTQPGSSLLVVRPLVQLSVYQLLALKSDDLGAAAYPPARPYHRDRTHGANDPRTLMYAGKSQLIPSKRCPEPISAEAMCR